MADRLGKVFVVGAGPGDPRLLTLRAVTALKMADVVIYDRLIHPNILDISPPFATRIYAGKEHRQKSTSQDAINQLLVHHAQLGHTVVRLKGGDPLLFGRGGEEAEVLQSYQIPFEIIPGLSSSMAALAYAGIPVTHRQVVRGVSIVGGFSGEFADVWQDKHAWIVLMGLEHVQPLVDHALQAGFPPTLAACAIEWGTWGSQRVVRSSLRSLPRAILDEGVESPCVLVFGDNVKAGENLSWFDTMPARNQRVLLITTYPIQPLTLMAYRDSGAEVFNWSLFLQPPVDEQALVTMSSESVIFIEESSLLERLVAAWHRIGRDIRQLPQLVCPAQETAALETMGFREYQIIEGLTHDSVAQITKKGIRTLYVPLEYYESALGIGLSPVKTWTLSAKPRTQDPLWDYHLQRSFDIAVIGSEKPAKWYVANSIHAKSLVIPPALDTFFDMRCADERIRSRDGNYQKFWDFTNQLSVENCED